MNERSEECMQKRSFSEEKKKKKKCTVRRIQDDCVFQSNLQL